MTVRVKLRLRGHAEPGRVLETVALVNSGYEAERPEILLPRRAAEQLSLPLEPPHARTYVYESPFGVYRLLLIPRALKAELMEAEASSEHVDAAVSDYEREVLISDMLAEELGIMLLALGKGSWKHATDPQGTARPSAPPEYW